MIGPKGKFMLEPDDDRTHLFVSSGTGNAPFIAMMRQTLADGRPRKAVFLNGVSYVRDLGYRDIVERLGVERRVPRPLHPDGLASERPGERRLDGRTGRVETIVAPVIEELGLSPDDTVAYLCGNPDMIISAEQTLLELGLPEDGGQEGAVLAEGQGAAGRGRRRRRRCGGRRGRVTPLRPIELLVDDRVAHLARRGGVHGGKDVTSGGRMDGACPEPRRSPRVIRILDEVAQPGMAIRLA